MRISLFSQNLSVALSCVAVCVRISVEAIRNDERLAHVLEAVVIATAIVAMLASVAYKTAIEKDWLVVIAGGDSSRLASMWAEILLVSDFYQICQCQQTCDSVCEANDCC